MVVQISKPSEVLPAPFRMRLLRGQICVQEKDLVDEGVGRGYDDRLRETRVALPTSSSASVMIDEPSGNLQRPREVD